MQCCWQSPLLDQQQRCLRVNLTNTLPSIRREMQKRRAAAGCRGWSGLGLLFRVGKSWKLDYYYYYYYKYGKSSAVHCTGLLILAQYRGSPTAVPNHLCSQSCTATFPRARHGWSGSHFHSCWRIKSKQQPQKTCRPWAQVGVIAIFCFLQCKKLCMHIYKHMHAAFRIPIRKTELYRDIMTYYLTYTLKWYILM